MFFQLTDLPAHVWISGFTTKPTDIDATLRAIQERFPAVAIQLVDLDRVPGSRYTLLATLNALKSFHSKQPIAKTLGMEILLYMAASRQIGEAIERAGISPSTERIIAVMVAETREDLTLAVELLNQLIGTTNDDRLVDEWSPDRLRKVQSTFDIGTRELRATLRANETKAKAVERLATERSALLTVRK